MVTDYLVLSNGRKVRILFNMNAIEAFVESTGLDIADLTTVDTDIGMFRSLLYACACEGEEADGRKLELDEKQLGRLVPVPGMTEFSRIMRHQGSGIAQKKNRPRGWWMKRR